jgi:coiled-coil and C2 domain-containing protein 2A
VKLFLENIEGQSVFIPRFLSPIAPPAKDVYTKGDFKAIERAARFVSLIPFIDDSQLFKDMPDLTCSS